MKRYPKDALSLAIVGVISTGIASLANAQTATDAGASAALEEVEVTGFRSSIQRAKDLKRDAMVAQDSIVAEDIADFPDLNLADSLQRVPGVAITREGGEGRQISLRGLGPDFTRVQVNGMEALGTSSSPMDSRGAVTRTRAFDFNIFASELFNRIDVKKSYSADQDEGGIGGTVNLYTAKPFDFDGFESAISSQMGTNSNTDSTDPRFAALISNTWGNFGALASVAYSERETNEHGYNTYRWRQKSTDNISDAIDAETADLIRSGDLWFARGNRYSVWRNNQERLGITTSFQYQPSDELTFSLDYMHGKLQNNGDEHHLATGGSSSTALGRVEELMYAENNGDLEVIYGRFSDTQIRTESRVDENSSTFDQVTLNADWMLTDKLHLFAQVGTSESNYDSPRTDKANLMRNGSGITTDFSDRFHGKNSYDFDTTSLDGWQVKDLYFREDYISNSFDNAKFDFDYDINESSQIKFGANYKKFGNSGERREDSGYVQSKSTPLNDGVILPTAEITNVFSEYPGVSWVQLDLDKAQDFYGISDLALGSDDVVETTTYSVQEETSALYAQYSLETLLGGHTLRASAGLRYYDTELTSKGVSQGENITLVRDYNGVLPTFNLVYELQDDLLFRFGASKNVTRPSLDAISVSASVSQMSGTADEVGKIAIGNPALEPFESVNFDASIEWYNQGIGFVSAAVFHKDIDNFIVTEVETYRYSELGLPESVLPTGATTDTLFDVASPQNSDASTIKGFELAYQRDFDFLPGALSNFGMIANYTWVDGEAVYRDVQGTGEDQVKSFPGLSDQPYNLTLYYETDKYGARVSSAYRSDYISSVEGGLRDEDERGFHESTYVDFSAFYQVTDSLKLNLEGINLTNEEEVQYSDSSDRPYNTTTSGRTIMAGLTYKF